MFHNLYICSCITCCLIVYNYLYYHALCGAFSEIKSFKVSCHNYIIIVNDTLIRNTCSSLQFGVVAIIQCNYYYIYFDGDFLKVKLRP